MWGRLKSACEHVFQVDEGLFIDEDNKVHAAFRNKGIHPFWRK